MKIIHKLLAAGAVFVASIVILALVMSSTLGTITEDVHVLSENDLPATSLLLNLDRDAYQAQLALERYMAEEDGEHATAALESYNENAAQVEERFLLYEEASVGVEGEAAEQEAFWESRDAWLAAADRAIELRDAGYGVDSPQLQAATDNAALQFDDMREHIDVIYSNIYEERAHSFGAKVVEEADSSNRTLWLLAVVSILASLGAIVYLARQLGRPLRTITEAARQVAVGNTSAEIAHTSKDETGEIADAFRDITAYLRDAAEAATQVADGNLTTTVTLRSDDDALGIALTNMIDGLRDVVAGAAEVTRQVDDGSELLAASSEESAKAASEVATSINSVADGATDQAMIAENLAKAVRDIVTELEATTKAFADVSAASSDAEERAGDGVEKVEQAIAAMNRITGVFAEASETVTQLGEYSEKVEDIVELIRSIADQTNLLALNAAIEAARAGEMGRGFAVVASEVKSLAEESSQSTEQIAEIVAQMRDSISGAIATMTNGRGDVDSGSAMVNTAGSSFTSITEAVQIISAKVDQATKSAGRIQHATDAIDASSSQLIEITESASAASAEVAASSEQAAATSQEIGATAQELSTSAKALRGAMDRFRL